MTGMLRSTLELETGGPKPNDPFPNSTEFHAFFSDSGNKLRLQRLFKNHLLQKNLFRKLIYCERKICIDVTFNNEIPNISLDHTKADTMILSIYAIIRQKHPALPIIIDRQDTDVYVQAAYVAHQLQGDLFIKCSNSLVNCSSLLNEELSNIIIAARLISGCDHTPGLYGHGKKKLMKKLTQDAESRELLTEVGSNISLDDKVKYNMEQFVLTKIYGCDSGMTWAEASAEKWRKQKNKNTLNLPPDTDSLHHHLTV